VGRKDCCARWGNWDEENTEASTAAAAPPENLVHRITE